ncbi:ftsK/SpoIIIE family protein [Mycobacterium xenopi 3993]|nr:ftsK/SpoIIIE family protein [Mycobacterium xenopi 3993]
MLARAAIPPGRWRWPLGEIDKPFEMRRDPLIFDALSSAGNMVIHGGPKSGSRPHCRRSSCRPPTCIRPVK